MPDPALVAWIAERQKRAGEPCRHRGSTIDRIRRKCCGNVERFHCAALGHTVEETKCRSCVCRP